MSTSFAPLLVASPTTTLRTPPRRPDSPRGRGVLEWISLSLGVAALLLAFVIDATWLVVLPAHVGLACGIIAACRPTTRPVLTALAISLCAIAFSSPLIAGVVRLAGEGASLVAVAPHVSTGPSAGEGGSTDRTGSGGGVRLTSDTVRGTGTTDLALQPPSGSRIDQGLTVEADTAIRIEGLDASGNVVQTILDEQGAYDGSATWNNDPAVGIQAWRVTTDGEWKVTFLLVEEMP